MGFAVVHMQKIKSSGVRGIQSHNQREKESHTNPDIDYSRSHLNYDVMFSERQNYHRAIKDRLELYSDTIKTVRKDAVLMCNFIITSDYETMSKLTPEQQYEFFTDSAHFMARRYGPETVVNATVHMDEKTPHMHLGLVPITEQGRLSAKTLFDRKELAALQTDFAREVGNKYGMERGVEGSERTHLTEQRFKLETARAQERAAAERAANLRQVAERETRKAADASESARKVEQRVNTLEEQKNALRGQIRALESELKGKVLTLKEIQSIQPQQTITGAVKGVTVSEIEDLKATAWKYHGMKHDYEKLAAQYQHDKKFIPSAQERLQAVRDRRRLEQLENAFQRLPAGVKEQVMPTKQQERGQGRER